jgi:hypothetical protein
VPPPRGPSRRERTRWLHGVCVTSPGSAITPVSAPLVVPMTFTPGRSFRWCS